MLFIPFDKAVPTARPIVFRDSNVRQENVRPINIAHFCTCTNLNKNSTCVRRRCGERHPVSSSMIMMLVLQRYELQLFRYTRRRASGAEDTKSEDGKSHHSLLEAQHIRKRHDGNSISIVVNVAGNDVKGFDASCVEAGSNLSERAWTNLAGGKTSIMTMLAASGSVSSTRRSA